MRYLTTLGIAEVPLFTLLIAVSGPQMKAKPVLCQLALAVYERRIYHKREMPLEVLELHFLSCAVAMFPISRLPQAKRRVR